MLRRITAVVVWSLESVGMFFYASALFFLKTQESYEVRRARRDLNALREVGKP